MDKLTPLKIENLIYVIRGQRVMLDSDLAALYEVETKALNRQVRRNIDRFPSDFMFELSQKLVVGANKKKTSYLLKTASPCFLGFFTRLRSFLMIEHELKGEFRKMKSETSKVFRIVFERLDSLEESLDPQLPTRRKKIGLK